MRELLDKNGKRKKENKRIEEKYWSRAWTKKGAKFAGRVAVFLGEAEWKLPKLVQSSKTARRAVNEGAQFSENVYSNHLWNMI